jgi:DNA-directed RNA polymerase subunit RPC12/RpoP
MERLPSEREQVRSAPFRYKLRLEQWTELYNRKFAEYWSELDIAKALAVWGTKEKLARLEALDPETATAADVEKIVGGPMFAMTYQCWGCSEETFDAVILSDDSDSPGVYCKSCLQKAIDLLS